MNIIKANNVCDLYINQLMELEQVYKLELRETAEEKKELYTKPGSILLLSLKDKLVVGERSGLSLKDIEEEDLLDLIPNYYEHYINKSLYVHSFTVRPEFQGKGLGKELTQEFIKEAKRMGYKRIIGHAKEGPSLQINRRYGSQIIQPFKNWYDTGDTYYFHSLKL